MLFYQRMMESQQNNPIIRKVHTLNYPEDSCWFVCLQPSVKETNNYFYFFTWIKDYLLWGLQGGGVDDNDDADGMKIMMAILWRS